MPLSGDEFTRMCRARDRLRDVSSPTASLESIAREAGISHFHFIRRFRAMFGVTPHQYRIDARLRDARLLLAHGSSVTETCLAVGFESVGTFSTLFTHRVGLTPIEYRRNTRTSVTVPGGLSPVYFPGCLSLMANLPASAFRANSLML
ncbi:MAG TPA: AraC family transcriptional regulator [Acidobacteriaceae bacterium]|jgi:AraC-like DNA-binding protein